MRGQGQKQRVSSVAMRASATNIGKAWRGHSQPMTEHSTTIGSETASSPVATSARETENSAMFRTKTRSGAMKQIGITSDDAMRTMRQSNFPRR